ncbi:protein transport protein Sec31A-like isoform X2 [Mizuhopecten yessoensis]|uniref:protein transport protein Sec31A-like isoform X2 n=1 Tax=Mizuhopecten yessoensis TaxID=6573 RepID=UPI000B45B5D4|nr:protein transport protein Sec31A-like isoform X2 [Mizuhopecten yessoensis]
MRVKEIERTANVAWSPAAQHPIYMVAGTAAQQLDATFSTSAALEVYSLNLGDPTLNMPLVSTVPSDCRFHKLVWGSHGMSPENGEAGFIVGGTDNGGVYCYSATKMIRGDTDCLQFKQDKHTGAVKALDFNPFQSNLLATGASDSEIHIWDLNKPDSPMTPGAKSQPPEEVACVAWNQQVQHILASTFTARCVVWDLRKNEPIIKISESMSRMKSKSVAWHPEVATQLCLSSEDDHTPIIQLWDLRYATSPLKAFENHKRGVLDIAWCAQDSDLLLSCGKDNRILCWNPNSNKPDGEVVYELPTSTQWSFDVQWCPRNPAIISSSSFDGHVTMYTLMGGGHPVQQSNKVAESFNTNDPFAQGAVSQAMQQADVVPLQKAPKWLRRPCGASFAFGGKLVSFDGSKAQPSSQQPAPPREVFISQVVTETDLITCSSQLEQALINGQYVEFCAMKAANCQDTMQESIWNFLRVNFEKEPREHYIQLLGYDKTDLAKKVAQHASGDDSSVGQGVDASELAQKMSLLDTVDLQRGLSGSGQASPSVGSKTPVSRDEFNSSASSVFDDIAAQNKKTPGSGDELSAFDDIAAHQKEKERPQSPLNIPSDGDADGLLSQALLMGNFEAAVDICLSEDKMAEAVLLAIAGGPDLLSRTQKTYFKKNKSSLGRLISSVVTHNWSHIIQTCNLDNWKEALALILTYASQDEFVSLCDTLATRLESERAGNLSMYASLCYICSGNVDKLVENWNYNTKANNTPMGLQDLVEKVMVLRKAVSLSRGQEQEVTKGLLANKLNGYASLLAAQGSMETAMRYLGNSSEANLSILKDRLFHALEQSNYGVQAPPFPFNKVNLIPQGETPVQSPTHRTAPAAHSLSSRMYQTHAGATFNTSTTGSKSYAAPNQYPTTTPYSTMNGQASTNPGQGQGQSYGGQIYNPNSMPSSTASNAASGASAPSKGPLSHKYPQYPQAMPSYDQAQQYGPGSYGQQQYQPGYTGQSMSSHTPYYGDSAANPAGSQMGSNQASNIYNPTNTMTSVPPQHAAASSTLPSQSSFMDHKPATAWNDPPLVKDRKPKSESHSQAPFTSPLYGMATESSNQQAMPADQGPPGAPVNYSNLYNPQEHQREVQAPPSNASVPEPVQPVAKQPIPSEHQVLQDIFGSLVNNCSSVASNAQMKRKLDDVSKKLEILYDRLRNEMLSQNVLLGLHQIVQAIQQYDYNTGIQVYTQMVSQGNFSEISSFMPGLKMLLQSAMQMQVYVQTQ